MLLRGRVLDMDEKPARRFELVATVYNSHLGHDVLPARVNGNEFEVWVPVGGSHASGTQIAAIADNGNRRAIEGVGA